MGCNCGRNKPEAIENKPLANLKEALVAQPNKVKWFLDGASKLYKAATGETIYSDADITSNRDICRGCEFASKTNGKLTMTSQCMAIDPETNAPCGCFILAKTQQGVCPLKNWISTPLTIKKS